MEISINSFRKTGLYPLNRDVFCDYHFPAFETNNENLADPIPDVDNVSNTDEVSSPQLEPTPGPGAESKIGTSGIAFRQEAGRFHTLEGASVAV